MAFVIVGSGQAGGWAAKTLRDQGIAAPIVLIGEEPHPPHERPPLSKDVLLGRKPPESTYIFPVGTLAKADIELRHALVTQIERARKRVVLAGGESLPYDRMLLATGSRVRRLAVPGASLPGIHYLRSIEDSLVIRRELGSDAHILVVGGGWIGLEAAAAARSLGARVTLVEYAGRLCCRALPPGELATYLLDLHRRNGVDVRLKTTVTSFAGTAKVECAMLSNGEEIPVTAAIIGIGIVPNVELAGNADLAVDDGIVVDGFGRTSDPDIFAAGDCTNQPNDFLRRRVRLESWANAQNQAIAVAKAMAGGREPYQEMPWFWSDQYGVNLQLLGMPADGHTVVTRGDTAGDQFLQFYLTKDRIEAVAAVNNARELRYAKRLMQAGKAVPAEKLWDSGIGMQELIKVIA
jgi:3-phenylpropionate/trans-cinnamate dioxygenase ferredoxin reductase component